MPGRLEFSKAVKGDILLFRLEGWPASWIEGALKSESHSGFSGPEVIAERRAAVDTLVNHLQFGLRLPLVYDVQPIVGPLDGAIR